MEASYNKVPIWDYSKLCGAFGPSFPTRYYRVETGDQLVELISDSKFNAADCTQVGTIIVWMLVRRLLIATGCGVGPGQA
jgi:pyruvate decarboxylase